MLRSLMLINMFSLSPFTPLVDNLSAAFYVIFVSFMGEQKCLCCVHPVSKELYSSLYFEFQAMQKYKLQYLMKNAIH